MAGIGSAMDSACVTATITSVGTSRCAISMEAFNGVLKVPIEWMKHVQVGNSLTISGFTVAWMEEEIIFDATANDVTILLHPDESRGEVTFAEAFAGISGWAVAGKRMGLITSLYIERHEDP